VGVAFICTSKISSKNEIKSDTQGLSVFKGFQSLQVRKEKKNLSIF
jgi:hypothetical protein